MGTKSKYPKIRESLNTFKKTLKFIQPSQNRVYNFHNHKGIKLLKRLRVVLRHLCEQEFKHSFRDTLNPIYNYGGRYRCFSTFLNVQTIYRKEWLSWIQSSVLLLIFKI